MSLRPQPQRRHADLNIDAVAVLMTDHRLVVADDVPPRSVALQQIGEGRALVINDEGEQRRQHQQLIKRVAGDLAESVVHVERTLAVHDDQPLTNLALGLEKRLEKLSPPAEYVFESLAREHLHGLTNVPTISTSDIHAAAVPPP